MVIKSQLEIEELIREDRVHRRIYTDPDIFALEMERIFGRSWVYVAHESELAQPGDYKTTTIGLQPVIVSRGADDGQVHVLYNRCRHRGATVCQFERGNSSYFRCAYHGWTFNNQGNLIGVTYRDGYPPNFDFGQLALTPVARVGNYRGFIFASLSPDVPDFEEWLGPARLYLDQFADQSSLGEIEVRAGVHKYAYQGNWKFQMENNADNYHVDFTHQVVGDVRHRRAEAIGKPTSGLRQPPGSKVRDLGYGHSINDRCSPPSLLAWAESTGDGRRYLQSLEEKVGSDRARELFGQCGGAPWGFEMFPNLILINIQIRVVRPLSPGQTEVLVYPTLLKGVPEEVNALRLRQHEEFWGPAGFGSPDDVEMFARAQAGVQSEGSEWLIMARGLHREEVDVRGSRFSEIKDETGMRGIYREWKRLMTAE